MQGKRWQRREHMGREYLAGLMLQFKIWEAGGRGCEVSHSSKTGKHLRQELFQLGTVCLQLCDLMAQVAHGLHAAKAAHALSS